MEAPNLSANACLVGFRPSKAIAHLLERQMSDAAFSQSYEICGV